ncbi:hypothetical protein MW887_007377 [Aspergillus wentii]|nr:hypothetical protein MW887_007377 [Aspergillus wentii]
MNVSQLSAVGVAEAELAFIRRTAVGPAILTVEDTKLGARTSTIHVKLSQPREKKQKFGSSSEEEELEVKVAGYITVTPSTAEVGVSTNTGWAVYPPTHPGTGPEGKVNLGNLSSTGQDGEWTRQVAPFPDFRRATQQLELFGPDSKAKKSQVVDQWARFRPGGDQGGRWSNEAVVFLTDMFPMALDGLDSMSAAASGVYAQDTTDKKQLAKFWYPTVTLNIDLTKRMPVEGVEWLYSRVQIKVVRNGRTEIEVAILDEAGETVAFSTQVGLVVSASRNVGKRSML